MAINQLGGGSAALEAKFNAKGDILVATANDLATNVSVGTNGQILVADSSQAAGVVWATNAPDVATTKGDLITRTASGYARIGVGSNGQGLLADSSTATGLVWGAPASVAYYDKSQVFTSSGTWTAPTAVTKVNVLCIGAGGGGAAGARIGAGASATAGGGGAGGNSVYIKDVPVTPGTTYTVAVGSGGLGGVGLNVFQSSSNTTQTTGPGGSNGGDSSFGSANTIQYVLAAGGEGGGTSNVSGGRNRPNNYLGQYTFNYGSAYGGQMWMGMYSYQNGQTFDSNTANMRGRWFSTARFLDTGEQFTYFTIDGSQVMPGGGSSSGYDTTTTPDQQWINGAHAGYGNQPSRDTQMYWKSPQFSMVLNAVNGGSAGATGNAKGGGAGTTAGYMGGGGLGGRADQSSAALSSVGQIGNVGAGSGGGAGFNGNAGNGGNAGANTGSGGGGGGGSFGASTYISGSGGVGGSGIVALSWIGA
jgi:hypothetical protein